MSLFTKVFGTYSDRQVKKIEATADKIEALGGKYAAMSDAELRAQTDVLRGRLAKGETTDDILPDAFAVVAEASERVLGMRPFRVQLIGGVVIHQGRIAEMKTGEGKTLVATLPAYLNALTGAGVHIVTVNDYLARYQSEWMGILYRFLGLSVGLIVNGLDSAARKKAYAADITYGTNNEMGFDYLRDNMVIYKERMVQRGHAFAIVDEVDSILIDEARTPLIISGPGDESDPLYEKADRFARTLKCFRIKEIDSKKDDAEMGADADYIVDEKARNAVLTTAGTRKAEAYFGLENLADAENSAYMHHINNAIRAHGVMQRDVDYVVKDGQVLIVDSFTGRIMLGRRYSNGLHQAIEAKEGVKIERENKTQATITFQNYFRLYKKLSGMTGTALTEENEFREIYALDVVEVPTNRPMIRIDHNDLVYKSAEGKYRAIIEQIIACHEKGQPVLVGTVSIDKSELISKLLTKRGVKHNVLNAKFHDKEAEIIAQAGKLGAITISTNMAGRGTDIKLGGNADYLAKGRMASEGYDEALIFEAAGYDETTDEEILAAREHYRALVAEFDAQIKDEAEKVKAAGGLYVLGTERHESRRIDNQLRGRAGRQGDPGESRFFLSLEDDLLRLFGSDRLVGMVNTLGMDDDTPIKAGILSSSIENAQKRIEGTNFERRKNVLQFDDVNNQQRELIYRQRREVLEGGDLREKIHNMIEGFIDGAIATYVSSDIPDEWNLDGLRGYLYGVLCGEDDFRYAQEELNRINAEDIRRMLLERADALYKKQEELFTPEVFREVERIVLLENVDRKWVDHIDAMDDLMSGVGLRAYAQTDPVIEYKREGYEMFEQMIAAIQEETIRRVFLARVQVGGNVKRERVAKGMVENVGGDGTAPKKQPVKVNKIGRNDPCPCGSGLKWKKCTCAKYHPEGTSTNEN